MSIKHLCAKMHDDIIFAMESANFLESEMVWDRLMSNISRDSVRGVTREIFINVIRNTK